MTYDDKVDYILSKFPGTKEEKEERFKTSPLFHKVVTALANDSDQYVIIGQIIDSFEDIQKSYAKHLLTGRPPNIAINI